MTYDQLRAVLFPSLIKKYYGEDIDGLAVADEFHGYFHDGHKLLPGAKDTLIYAKKLGYSLAVLSNGEQFGQERRLKLAGIHDYFDLIVTSELAGCQKPDPEILTSSSPKATTVQAKRSSLATACPQTSWVQPATALTASGTTTATARTPSTSIPSLKWTTMPNSNASCKKTSHLILWSSLFYTKSNQTNSNRIAGKQDAELLF